jgi:NTP pyrophosphatase (non-canonical NTP hydrolase)
MDFKEYTKETQRTMAELGQSFADQLHMVMGISTEAGELLDTYKKTLAYNKELDIVNIKEEIGDLLWYISNLLRVLDMDFEQVLYLNVEKLKARYPEKFTEDNAINRDLEAERKVLETPDEQMA